MTYDHTKDIKMSYKVETAYASGKGSNKYDSTVMAAGDSASMTAMNFIQEGFTIPQVVYDRVDVRGPGDGADTVHPFVAGYDWEKMKLTIPVFIQNSTWLDAAIQASAGAIPTSYLFHFEGEGKVFDFIGCVLEQYTLKAGDKFPFETLVFNVYDVKTGNAFTTPAHPAFNTAQPKINKDITLNIAANAFSTMKSLTLDLKLNFPEPTVAGKYQRYDPVLISREYTLDYEAEYDPVPIKWDGSTEALTVRTAIVNQGYKSLTSTNLRLKDGFTNEYPIYGIIPKKGQLTNGGAVAHSTA